MAKKRVADVLVDTLVAAGVERIYGVSGDSLNGITDSIRPRDNIEWVHVRHEETAAFAAGAEALLTGRLAVCWGELRTGQPSSDQRPLRLSSQPRSGACDCRANSER